MRIYKSFTEAIPEIKRDLVEMGIKVSPKSYQDKDVSDNPDFDTLELSNYIYTVVNPQGEDLEPVQPWADMEWHERYLGIQDKPLNPGEAWKERRSVWTEFLREGKFAYTYSSRFARYQQVMNVINRIKIDPDSRQLFISVWDVTDNTKMGGISRIPCTLGYQIQVRRGALNITYLQRSCDLATHFVNDVYLAHQLQCFIATETGQEIGTFTHWMGSLHLFKKDGEGVF